MTHIWQLARRYRETIQPSEELDIGVIWTVTHINCYQYRDKQRYMLQSAKFTYNSNWQCRIISPHVSRLRNIWVNSTSIFVTSETVEKLWMDICIPRLTRVVYHRKWKWSPIPTIHTTPSITFNSHANVEYTICATRTSHELKLGIFMEVLMKNLPKYSNVVPDRFVLGLTSTMDGLIKLTARYALSGQFTLRNWKL